MKIPTQQILIALLLTWLTACSKITQDNYDKIENGMTMAEVTAILGEPTETSSVGIGGVSGTSASWQGEDITISIQFFNEKVQLKSSSQ